MIAACIDWIRRSATLVAILGDSVTTEKIFSDVGERNVTLPYLCFSEPEEVEGYETPGPNDHGSSLAEGMFVLEVYNVTKISARTLAEQIARRLNDAPLVFDDGELVYLRRIDRKYPTQTTLAPGTQIVQYKRVLEFSYKIERTGFADNTLT